MIYKHKLNVLLNLLNVIIFIIADKKIVKDEKRVYNEIIIRNVKEWAINISNTLSDLNNITRRNEVKSSFKNTNVIEEEWEKIVLEIANNIKNMMAEKVDAVKAIKYHAESLSEHRKTPVGTFSGYKYYDTNELDQVEDVEDRHKDRLEAEEVWKCSIPQNQAGLCYHKPYQSDEEYHHDKEYEQFNVKSQPKTKLYERSIRPNCAEIAYLKRPKDYYKSMNMVYDPHFDAEVNTNYSIIRVTPSVHARAPKVLNGIRWSEALDLTFKCNFENDRSLTYQYFGSPQGFVRFYPAMKWSEEEYDQTFDFRIRSWYIESISSAKDIIILLDRSGSMKGNRRLVATEIVNSILDTLTDNDYVNIYTFTNSSESLVDCFNDTLVQANEENLRLLREQLHKVNDTFYSDISKGFDKAFPILWKYRKQRLGGVICNQAIMLITEGLDYEYNETFKTQNFLPNENKYYRPIRVFTYLLGTEPNDAQRMKFIACANMGYYVNITIIEEVREKVLKYLEVMSRPINLSPELDNNNRPSWTALYVHLADRRLSNWLWKKNEGIRQRDIFIDYGRERNVLFNRTITPNITYFTETTEHEFDKYLKVRDYKYLTSVSLPVFDKRPNQTNLLGVAGVDVPLDYIKQLTEPHRIGVNGYAFIITNNGYVLHHPDHRKEFKGHILKPTFNRVDFTEVELSDLTTVPRIFDETIIKLRNSIVIDKNGSDKLNVRTPIDDMRRVIIGNRSYYYSPIGPFTLVIALPDRYGNLVIRHSEKHNSFKDEYICHRLKNNSNWRIHPKWSYTCKTLKSSRSAEKDLLNHWCNLSDMPKSCNTDLIKAVKKDIGVTEWFNTPPILRKSKFGKDLVLVFLATHAGLTRWKNLAEIAENENHFANKFNQGPDEVYYRRSAEFNYDKPDTFLYSVPFSMDEEYNEATTLITASNVIFQKNKFGNSAPVAAVGFQILHKAVNSYLSSLKFKQLTSEILKNFNATKEDEIWKTYVLDNDGIVILNNDTKNAVGKSIADVDKIITDYLVKDGIYKELTVFDYQGTCYPEYTNIKTKFYGPSYEEAMQSESCDIKRSPIKCKTIEFLKRQMLRTTPTPCDIELKMYHSMWKNYAYLIPPKNELDCNCNYISQHITGTNLMLIVVKENCCHFDEDKKRVPVSNEFPKQMIYNLTLPCYIETVNKFNKSQYTQCVVKNEKEFIINGDNENCGGVGIIPLE